jgi:hypothetical protein
MLLLRLPANGQLRKPLRKIIIMELTMNWILERMETILIFQMMVYSKRSQMDMMQKAIENFPTTIKS